MRIAILHNHPIHYKHLLFTAIAALGVEVDVVFVARSSNARTASLQPAGETYHSHFLSEGTFEAVPQLKSAFRAVKVVSKCSPDVVVISGYSYLAAWSVLLWARIRRLPIALWSESNRFDHRRNRFKEAIKRAFVRGCSVGHVYGRSNRDYLESLGMEPAQILEKRATVDSGIFMRRRASFHTDFRRVIYVGRFSPEKNLARMLEAFRITLNSHKVELVMVGYGPEESMLKAKVRELGLGAAVVFAGSRTQEEVASCIANSDCLVLPSLSETWGLVVNEAQCTGVPVIVSNRCGCARDLVNMHTGWVVDPENTAELADAMGKMCSLPVQRLREMGSSAVRLAVEYTPQRCAARIVGNLESIVVHNLASRGGQSHA